MLKSIRFLSNKKPILSKTSILFYSQRKMSSNADCLFCKIVAGKIPSKKISETDTTIAFLDIFPTSKGHALVIPKYHAEKLTDLPADQAKDIGPELIKVSKAITKATGVEDFNILQNNGEIAHQVVKHVHFHIIPKPNEEKGLGVKWPSEKADEKDLDELLKAVVEKLEK